MKGHDSCTKILHPGPKARFELVNATFANGGRFTTKSVASILEIDLDATIQH
jgi:hypothetical protein